MPSLITSIIGGIQGASASHNAANYLRQGYSQAGQTVQDAVNRVNPDIINAAGIAGNNVIGAGGIAGNLATDAAQRGTSAVTGSMGDFASLLAPYLQGGAGAMSDLISGLAPGGSLSTPFTASLMAQYSPAYQFQLQQGQDALKRQAAASGLTGSGGTMRSLQNYTQDYANTAFASAANLYNQQQQAQFGRLATLAGMGQSAGTTLGQAGLGAAEYASNLQENAAQYTGNMGVNAAQWAGGANIGAANTAASNTLSGANYLANTQIEAQKALAQGDLGAAASWNNMLGGIGAAGNTIMFGGMDPTGGGSTGFGGWSLGNIGTNLWGGGYGGYGSPPMTATAKRAASARPFDWSSVSPYLPPMAGGRPPMMPSYPMPVNPGMVT